MMAGLPKPTPNKTNPTLLNVLIKLESNGLELSTIKTIEKRLTILSKHADLNNPEQVKKAIAKFGKSNGYKNSLTVAYNHYCKYYKIEWEKPRYKTDRKIIKVPTNEKLEMLIAHARRTMATKLVISKENGLRPIEVVNLTPKDFDLERKLLYVQTAKHGNPRTLRISTRLQMMIKEYITTHNIQPNEKLFKTTSRGYSKNYQRMRNAVSKKLHDTSINQIRLYDLRHFYGTMLYMKTGNIYHVMQQLGHKDIKNTLIYIHLAETLIGIDEEYHVKTATTPKQAIKLIENGFTKADEIDGIHIYKKRK
jgi:integrase